MLSLTCRKRLEIEPAELPVERLADTRIRATDWDFAVRWTAPDAPRWVSVDGAIIRTGPGLPKIDSGEWWFTLPPTSRNLTTILVESFSGKTISAVVDVIPGYQIPDTDLFAFIRWDSFCRKIVDAFQTDGVISVYDLVEGIATFASDLQTGIEKADIPEELVREILYLLVQVQRSPLSRLIDEQDLVDLGEIRRVMPAAVDYFIRHPETWRFKNYTRPRPTRLLDDRSVENYDVYENRFILHFLREMDLRLATVIGQYQATLDELSLRLPEQLRFMQFDSLGSSDIPIETLLEQQRTVERTVQRLKSFKQQLRKVQDAPLFEHVIALRGIPRANTTLRLHPVYGRLYQIYQDLGQMQFSHQRLQWLDQARTSDLRQLFETFCLRSILTTLHQLHFQPDTTVHNGYVGVDVAGVEGRDGTSGSGLRLEFRHRSSPDVVVRIEYKLPEWSNQSFLEGAIHLVFRRASDQITETDVWLFPDPTWWGDTELELPGKQRELHEIYDRLEAIREALVKAPKKKDRRRRRSGKTDSDASRGIPGTLIMVHPTQPTRFDNRWTYEELRLLLTQGDNFANPEQYERFGDYRIGALPLFPSIQDISRNNAPDRGILRLMRLIRIQLFRVGVMTLCWRCFQKAIREESKAGQQRYHCQSCNLRWGEIFCKCGGRIVKIDLRQTGRVLGFDSLGDFTSPVDSISLSEALEMRLAVASVCEAKARIDGFWAVCPSCGHCEKEENSVDCHRCKERQAIATSTARQLT